MATAKKPTTLAELTKQNANLDAQQAAMDAKVQNSGNFWTDATPSSSDLNLDIQARALKARKDALESNILSRKAYGEESAKETGTKKEGIISRVVGNAMKPLSAEVGAVKWATGMSDKNLIDSMKESVAAKETYGNILRQAGVAPKVSSVLGFGLDVIGDPFFLLTGGLSGVGRTGIGKVVKGAAAKGIEGAALGAKTSVLDIAAKAASFIPGTKVQTKLFKVAEDMAKVGTKLDAPEFQEAIKRAFYKVNPVTNEIVKTGTSKIVGDIRMGIKNLQTKAAEVSNQYDLMTGWDLKKTLDARADRESITEKIKSLLIQHPVGAKFVENFEYNSNQWMHNAKLWNALKKSFDSQGKSLNDSFDPATGMMINPSIKEIRKVLSEIPEPKSSNVAVPKFFGYTETNKGKIIEDIKQYLDEGLDVLKSGKDTRLDDAQMSYDAFMTELKNTNQWNDINDALYKMMGKEERGIVDKLRNVFASKLIWGKDSEKQVQIGAKILDFYDIALGIFKSAKISSLSPSSLMYAILGNGTMQHMAGINMLRPEVYNRLKDAVLLLSGGKYAGINTVKGYERVLELLRNKNFENFWVEHGDLAEQILGIDIGELKKIEIMVESELEKIRKMTPEELKKNRALYSDAEMIRFEKMNAARGQSVIDRKKYLGASSMDKPRDKSQFEMPTGITANEIASGRAFVDFREKMATSAEKGNIVGKAMTFMFNRSKDFEKTDQIWKLQNFLLLTQDGLSERELLKLTNNFVATTARIESGDITEKVIKNGISYYKLSPEKALEIANETFMNYAAMPAFVKAVRSLPVLGSPFFSFTYAMLEKTGKTMLNNPASFNQVSYFIKELEADKSPLERAALKSKYYSWIDKPGMVNLGENFPFFSGNPLYLNLAQMIPYYSLNILNPSTRNFNDTVRGKFASVLDSSPFMKDPVGQMLMDYIVLPSFLGQEPQNMFGGQLYPEGTSLLGKIGYVARTGAEAFVPSAAAPIGMMVPDSIKNLLPSYQARKLGFAAEGKTAIGVQTKEAPAQKGFRAALSNVGINLYPVDLTMIATEIKKKQSQ